MFLLYIKMPFRHHLLSDDKWIKATDSTEDISKKLRGIRTSAEGNANIYKLIQKITKFNTEHTVDKAFVPKMLEIYHGYILNQLLRDLSTSNSEDLVEGFIKEIDKLEKYTVDATSTLSWFKKIAASRSMAGMFAQNTSEYVFKSPLNTYIMNWKYDEDLPQNVINSTYTYLYNKYLRDMRPQARTALGCSQNAVSTGADLTSTKRVYKRKNVGTVDSIKADGRPEEIFALTPEQDYYNCDSLVKTVEPFVTSRALDLTIPSLGPIFTTSNIGLSYLINSVFHEQVTNIRVDDVLPDFPLTGLITGNIDKNLDIQHCYLDLNMVNFGTLDGKSGKKLGVESEQIKIKEKIEGDNTVNMFLSGNLFKVYDKNTEDRKIADVRTMRDQLYVGPMNKDILKKHQLKISEVNNQLSIEKIRNMILTLYSIYTKQGMDYLSIHKKDGAEEINRRIAKELLYLALFTFYKYLEHNVFGLIMNAVKSDGSLSEPVVKNIQKGFDNYLSLLRTNTVYLFKYNNKTIDMSDTYGIQRGRTNKIWSDKATDELERGEYYRLDNGYVNSNLDEGDDLEKFKEHFPFVINKGPDSNDVVIGLLKKTKIIFAYNAENKTCQYAKPDDNDQHFKLSTNGDDDLYLVDKKWNTGDMKQLYGPLKKSGIGRIIYPIDNEMETGNVDPTYTPTINSGENVNNNYLCTDNNTPADGFYTYSTDEEKNNKRMSEFLIGTSESTEDIATGEMIGFGIVPYRNPPDLPNRDAIIMEIFEEYCKSVNVYTKKNIIYIKKILNFMKTSFHIDYISKWYAEMEKSFEEIRNANDQTKTHLKQAFITNFSIIGKTIVDRLVSALKEYINADYERVVEKRLGVSKRFEIAQTKLMIAHHKLIMFKKILKIAYNDAVKRMSADLPHIAKTAIERDYIPKTTVSLTLTRIEDYIENEEDTTVENVVTKLKGNMVTREKSIKLGKQKELVSFFKRLVKEELDLATYIKEDPSIFELDERDIQEKLFAIDTEAVNEESVCVLVKDVLTIHQLTRNYLKVKNNIGSLLLNATSDARSIYKRYQNWEMILSGISIKQGYSNIMLPVKLKGLGKSYALLNVDKYLSVKDGQTKLEKTLDNCYFKEKIPKSKTSFNAVVLVNYDSDETEDPKKWTVIREDRLKVIEEEEVEKGNIKARYEFIFEILFSPKYYKRNFNALWNGGKIKNGLIGKKAAVSFRCLATRMNELSMIVS